ncbi:MAG TPA: aminoglycoside phosphotransferase family protein [Chloroflexota bacterium]|nr:aminoglycoside phosphotransferase family protein [Chloroflexota bacterium]
MAGTDVQREEIRNQVLRRADWRFLLANPRPAKSICLADGLLAEAVGLISDHMADARLDPRGDCDLAVAVAPDRTALRVAWEALRQGGSCYTEWDSVRVGGAAGIRRRLEAAGFEGVTCYMPRPSFSGARLWIPLDAPGAVRYFLGNRAAAGGAMRRIGRAVGFRVWAWLRLRIARPVCAVAYKPIVSLNPQTVPADPSHPAAGHTLPGQSSHALLSPNTELGAAIRAGWGTWRCGPLPDYLSWLMVTGGERSINKIVGLVFGEPDCRPRLAVKMPRVPESVPVLAKEAATLQAIHAARPSGVPGVPRVLFCREHGGLLTLGETALTGVPLGAVLVRENYRLLALKVVDWLAELPGYAERHPREGWWARLVQPVFADFQALFESILDPLMLDETRAILATLPALPLVCEQRDLGPWNVLLAADHRLIVLDWESAEVRGLPLTDLTYFLAYLAFALDGAVSLEQRRESYRTALDPSTFTGRVLYESVNRYTQRTDLDPSALRPLRLLTWMLHCRSDYRHFVADIAGEPDRETLRQSLFFSLWEEELQNGIRI